ncbi:MAG: phosphopantetheine-binding protein [Fuerstiella sp.]|nr:phosphopantetheine-binding protein [Fuerstiella sp.]
MSVSVTDQICELFENELQVSVPGIRTDLLEEGLLDSMVFVDLIMHLETRFQIEIPIVELEFDQFRTVEGIAKFIAELQTNGKQVSAA